MPQSECCPHKGREDPIQSFFCGGFGHAAASDGLRRTTDDYHVRRGTPGSDSRRASPPALVRSRQARREAAEFRADNRVADQGLPSGSASVKRRACKPTGLACWNRCTADLVAGRRPAWKPQLELECAACRPDANPDPGHLGERVGRVATDRFERSGRSGPAPRSRPRRPAPRRALFGGGDLVGEAVAFAVELGGHLEHQSRVRVAVGQRVLVVGHDEGPLAVQRHQVGAKTVDCIYAQFTLGVTFNDLLPQPRPADPTNASRWSRTWPSSCSAGIAARRRRRCSAAPRGTGSRPELVRPGVQRCAAVDAEHQSSQQVGVGCGRAALALSDGDGVEPDQGVVGALPQAGVDDLGGSRSRPYRPGSGSGRGSLGPSSGSRAWSCGRGG